MGSTSAASASANQTASPTPLAITHGVPVRTVSELLDARAAGEAPNGPYALRGYWSVASPTGRFGCMLGDRAELALACREQDWGITEWNEAMRTREQQAFGHVFKGPVGPWLQPWIASDAEWKRLRSIDPGRRQVAVPIVVVGHFDDPLAGECRPSTRPECLDRFVIDRIVEFDPASAPDPTAAPPPTPFPLTDPPPPAVDEAVCYPGEEKSFVGWARLRDLDIKLGGSWDPDSYVYAIVTRDVVTPGDPPESEAWIEKADYPGHKIRWWARAACLSEEPRTTLYGSWVLGSSYIEVDDGRHIDAPYPFPQ